MPQQAPVVGVGLFLEPDRKGAQPDHAMPAQQPDRLPVLGPRAALLHRRRRGLVGALQPQQEAQAAR